jgi:hypothetical protein
MTAYLITVAIIGIVIILMAANPRNNQEVTNPASNEDGGCNSFLCIQFCSNPT